MHRLGSFLLLLGFLSGCSLNTAVPLPRHELSCSPHRKIAQEQSVLTIVRPLDYFEDTNDYFQVDLLGAGILPFYVLMLNTGDEPIRVNRDDISLDFQGDRLLTPISARAVAGMLTSSKIAALELGTISLVFAFDTDYTRTSDFMKKRFPSTDEIAPYEEIGGVIFFQVAKSPCDVFGSLLWFNFQNLTTLENRTIGLAILDAETPLTASGFSQPAD